VSNQADHDIEGEREKEKTSRRTRKKRDLGQHSPYRNPSKDSKKKTIRELILEPIRGGLEKIYEKKRLLLQ